MPEHDASPEETLPDLLRDGLDLVFIGINPSRYSAAQGHYFARKTNRFWPCLSRSVLSLGLRTALGVERLEPRHDRLLLPHGIGFTDVVKRPTAKAAELGREEFLQGARDLAVRLQRFRPRVVCFQGVMGFRPFAAAVGWPKDGITLGAQAQPLHGIQIFVVPSPSPANAHVTPIEQVGWYDRLAAYLEKSDD
jgi:TDG/mug DNA glycosylase family protein